MFFFFFFWNFWINSTRHETWLLTGRTIEECDFGDLTCCCHKDHAEILFCFLFFVSNIHTLLFSITHTHTEPDLIESKVTVGSAGLCWWTDRLIDWKFWISNHSISPLVCMCVWSKPVSRHLGFLCCRLSNNRFDWIEVKGKIHGNEFDFSHT